MIIACPNCEARYRIDDARVGSPGARLRCARCQTLFRLPEAAPPAVASASLAATLKGAGDDAIVVPGKPDESTLYTRVVLPADHDDRMPPKGAPLTKAQTDLIKLWIASGAE